MLPHMESSSRSASGRHWSTLEREFEEHYAARHVDMSIYNQTLRRLKQWNTADVPETGVEYNVNLIYSIGQALDIEDKTIENDILTASGLSAVQKQQQRPVLVSSGSTNRPKEPARSAAASTMAPDTPTNMTPRLASLLEKGRAAMGTIQKDTGDDKKKADKTYEKESQKSKREKDAVKKKKEKSPVVNVDAEEEEQNEESEYEYYSSSSEPPPKKAKKGPARLYRYTGTRNLVWIAGSVVNLQVPSSLLSLQS